MFWNFNSSAVLEKAVKHTELNSTFLQKLRWYKWRFLEYDKTNEGETKGKLSKIPCFLTYF